MSLRTTAVLLVLFATTILSAQPQVPAAPPQTAREALIEMLTGGEKALTKHMTVEVQDLLAKPENKGPNRLAMFNAMQQQVGSGIQTFPTGPTLFAVNEPAKHTKFEVHVENDDLNGDQDILQLSLHSFRDGQEQQDEWGVMSSHITLTMKKQQNIWRLSNIGIGLEFPLGDAEFLKKTLMKAPASMVTGIGVAAPSVQTDLKTEKPASFDPRGTVLMLGMAEGTFARRHSEIGFTCSLPDLLEEGKGIGLEQQIASGSYMDYKWSLSGCEGKPAGSFQIVAEPIAQGRGAKAACTDATQNIRFSEDGHGATCLTSGKLFVNETVVNDGEGEQSSGYEVLVHPKPEEPKP
jgi:hypothetical protein